MSKALAVLKVFFSLVSINSTESPSSVLSTGSTSRSTLARVTPQPSFSSTAYVGQAFRIPIPHDTLDAVSSEDITNLRFKMKTFHYGDIGSLSWVQFDARKREVYGFPMLGNAGRFFYKIILNDIITGALVNEIIFALRVEENGFQYSHELILNTGINFNQFMTMVNMRIDFATKLARYCFNERPAAILVKSFDKASRNLTVVFVNIPYSPCDEKTYSKLRKSLMDEKSHAIQPNFQNALTERFPIQSAYFKFFGACDPNLFGPEPPFEWGWLKHFLPVAILLCVVGIPVAISCLVNKYRTKPPVVQEKRIPRTLRRRNEDGADFTSHTVHFNNRYPSMLSVSNNSKEDCVGEDEKGVNAKANIPNGSPSSRHLTIPNATANRPRQGATTPTEKAKNQSPNQNSPYKSPYNREKGSFNVREMWDDDDDTERPPLNIPVYYTYKNNEEEQPSMLDGLFDMNFSGIAGNISTKLQGVKSMLNISQAETATEQEATKPLYETSNPGPSLSSKLKGLGKSMLNISTLTTNEPGMAAGTTSSYSPAPSLSTKLRDFGKSMLNISISEDKKDPENSFERQKAAYDDSDDSESYIYKPREYEDARSERQRYDDARRGSDFTRDDGSGGHPRHSIRRNTSEYELSQYNAPVRRHSTSSDYHNRAYDRYNNNHYNFGHDVPSAPQTNRKQSRESDFDDYPDFLFDVPSEPSLGGNTENEKSIFDADFDDDEDTPCLAKPTPIWNHVPVVKGRGGLGIESFALNEVKYQDYTNPHQYSNGPNRLRGKSLYSALGRNSYSSQSTLDFWDDDEYDRKMLSWKQSSKAKDDFFFSSFDDTSVSDLRRGKGGIPNGTKPHSKSQPKQGNSLLPDVGSLFSRDTRNARDTREKPPVVFTLGDEERELQEQEVERDNSMVDLIKTRVSNLLEPDGNVSKWFSGFSKSDNPVT